jgi:Holliday junction resolvasome RuvABC endonuclease subunit
MNKSRLSEIAKINAPNNFCAIDASTNSMAFALFVNHKLESYGKIVFSGETIYEKIGDTAQKVKGFFSIYQTQTILIEKTIFANSPLVAANLALSQGSLIGAAKLSGVENVYGVTPIAWQSFIGTRLLTQDEKNAIKKKNPEKSNSWYKTQEREKRKNKTIFTVNNEFNIDISDNDVADACGIGMYALKNWIKVVKDEK